MATSSYNPGWIPEPSSAPLKKRSPRAKKIFFAVIIVIAIFAVLAGVKALQIMSLISQGESMVPPPEAVTTARVETQTWQPVIATIGTISAVQGVMVRAELGGTVKEIAFESGQEVEKDALLVQLDVAMETAEMRAREADAKLATEELTRASGLSSRKVISASELDSARAKAEAAEAQIESVQSSISKKTITAPFAGRVGIRQVNLGQVLEPGAEVVSLQTVQEVFADFTVPQQRLSEVSAGMKVNVATDAFPDRTFSGVLTAINSSLDAETRSIALQATLPNADGLLRPGMFARIEALLPEREGVLVVPATAVAYAPYGDSVYLIESKKNEKTGAEEPTLRQQFVRLGETRGDLVEVTEGVQEGQEIVSTGIFKLRNGMVVAINNELAPKPALDPSPPES